MVAIGDLTQDINISEEEFEPMKITIFDIMENVILPALYPHLGSLQLNKVIEIFRPLSFIISEINQQELIKSDNNNIMKDIWYKLVEIFENNIRVEKLKLVNLVDVLYAWSNINYLDESTFLPAMKTMDFLYQEIKKFKRHFNVEHISLILLALAKLKYQIEPDMLNFCLTEIDKNYKLLQINDISDILLALKFYNYVPDQNLMAKFFQMVIENTAPFYSYHTVNILYVSSFFDYKPPVKAVDKLLAIINNSISPLDIGILLYSLIILDYDLTLNPNKNNLLNLLATIFAKHKFDVFWDIILDTLYAVYHWDIMNRPIFNILHDIIIEKVKIFQNDSTDSKYLSELVDILKIYSYFSFLSKDMFQLLLSEIMSKYQDIDQSDVETLINILSNVSFPFPSHIIPLLRQKLDESTLSDDLSELKI